MRLLLLNVSPDELRAANEAARTLNVSRAEVFRRGLRHVLDTLAREAEAERRQKRVAEIIAAMDKMANEEHDPGWKPMEIVRAWRDRGRDAFR